MSNICERGHEYPSYKTSCSVCWAEEVSAMASKYPDWRLDETSPPGVVVGVCKVCCEAMEPAEDGECPNCNWQKNYKGGKIAEMSDLMTSVSCPNRHVMRGRHYELYPGCALCKLSHGDDVALQQSYTIGEENCVVVKNKKTGKTWVSGEITPEYLKALRILSAVGLRKDYAKYQCQADRFIGSPKQNIWIITDPYSLPMIDMRAWSLTTLSAKDILVNICSLMNISFENALKDYKKTKETKNLRLGDCRVADMLIDLGQRYKLDHNHDFLSRSVAY